MAEYRSPPRDTSLENDDDGDDGDGLRVPKQQKLGTDNMPKYDTIRPFKENKFWFLEHRHFVKTSFLWKVTLLVTFVEVVVVTTGFLIEQQRPAFDPFDPNCSSLDLSRFFLLGFAGTLLLRISYEHSVCYYLNASLL